MGSCCSLLWKNGSNQEISMQLVRIVDSISGEVLLVWGCLLTFRQSVGDIEGDKEFSSITGQIDRQVTIVIKDW